jgi:hypothetical protein
MDLRQQITSLQRELVNQHTGRMATTLAAPNAQREIKNKHRPTHWINLSRQADGKLVVGVNAETTFTIVGKIPIGFEFDRAVFDESDAEFYGLVDFQIEKYAANAGKSSASKDPGPLSMINTVLSREDAWGPSGFFDKQVGSADLDVTLMIFSWKKTDVPFHGITLLGKDHTNYCPIQDRIVPAKRGFKLLPQLGKNSSGMIQQLIGNMGLKANAVLGHIAGRGGYEQPPPAPRR